MVMMRLLILLLSLVSCFATFAHSEAMQVTQPITKQQGPLRIAVAANFAPLLKQLLPAFSAQTGIATQVISGASGTLFGQLQHGAPFDIFLSADATRPKLLAQQGLIIANSRKTYAIGQLALWSATFPALSIKALNQLNSRLAIANPRTTPYGLAAQQTLTALGLWSKFNKQLITGANINQTFFQVRSKNVTAGFVANSQLQLNQLQGVLIPQRYYTPLLQQLVIAKSSRRVIAAQRLSQYLLSEAVQQTIGQSGYWPARHSSKLKSAAK
jgi:molybdate transport system substrate-binding protein